jgi:galactokinase
MPCGIMDQYVSVFGRESAAILIDCLTLEHEIVELPSEVMILAVNTMVKHELGQTAYRMRVQECAAAVEAIRTLLPNVRSLRDVSPADFEAVSGIIPQPARQRARHVVTENKRVLEFVAACARADLPRMGELFLGSHKSLRLDYEVSSEELDFLIETASEIAGVFGARMTGGGFGGCTVNLLEPKAQAVFEDTISAAYRDRFGIDPQVYPCVPSAGARELAPEGPYTV